MFLVFLIKNICLLAFYFSYATMIFIQPVHKSMIAVYFMILGCFSLSYAFRFNGKYSKLKYLPVLGVVGAILYLRTVTGAALVIFPFVYMFLFTKKDDYYIDHYYFKELFIKLTIAILVLMIFVFMIGKLELFKSVSLQYVIVFFIGGLYLLRTTRHSKDIIISKRFVIMNLLIIIVTFLVCIILSSNIALNAVIYALKIIYSKLISPLLLGILYVVFWPLMKVMSMYASQEQDIEIAENIEEIAEVEKIIRVEASNEVFTLILYIFGLALLIFICAVLLKRYLSKQKIKIVDELEGIRQYRSFLEDDKKANKKGKLVFNNSINQIRYWYRKFLMLCYKRDMDIVMYDSSQSIHDKSCEMFVNSTQELESIKEIYRKARYSEEIINNQDVRKIKSIYKNLENDKNSKNK